MRRGGLPLLLLVWVTVSSTGCALTEPLKPVGRYAKDLFTFRGTDYSHPAYEKDPYWVSDVGSEARSDQVREEDPDQWYKKYLMSPKARSIERNLGVD